MGYIESEDRNGHVEVDDHEELAEVEKDLRQQDDASQVDSHTIQEALINSSALPAKAAQKVKIDWEIPRKVFHSSIGMSYCRIRTVNLFNCIRRLCDGVFIRLKRLSEECHSCSLVGFGRNRPHRLCQATQSTL